MLCQCWRSIRQHGTRCRSLRRAAAMLESRREKYLLASRLRLLDPRNPMAISRCFFGTRVVDIQLQLLTIRHRLDVLHHWAMADFLNTMKATSKPQETTPASTTISPLFVLLLAATFSFRRFPHNWKNKSFRRHDCSARICRH